MAAAAIEAICSKCLPCTYSAFVYVALLAGDYKPVLPKTHILLPGYKLTDVRYRDSWFKQVSGEQKQLAEDTATSHRCLEAARTAELAARKAALEFEARAMLASKEVRAQTFLLAFVMWSKSFRISAE